MTEHEVERGARIRVTWDCGSREVFMTATPQAIIVLEDLAERLNEIGDPDGARLSVSVTEFVEA